MPWRKLCGTAPAVSRYIRKCFIVEGKQKRVLLDECIKNQDLARYGIEVHGIGNVAKTIGALDFYKEARLQNERIRAGAYEEVAKGHLPFQKAYEKMLQDIEKVI